MKKYILIVVLVLGGGFYLHSMGTKPASIEATSKTIQRPKLYHVGDTQSGVTFTNLYAPATPFTSMDEVDPNIYYLVAVQLSVPAEDAKASALVYTSSQEYLKPQGGNVKECSDCAVFIVPRGVYVNTLVYKDLKWYL